MKETVNHFMRLSQLGYTRLVPIVPPGAPLSENSTLFKRIQKAGPDADARGKVPGVKGNAGWYGIDLTKDMDVEISRWHDMGAGVGIKTGRGLVAIDADTLNVDRARIIKQTIERNVAYCPPIRIGQYPKALYLVRTDEDFIYTRIEFGERDDKGRLKDRVEILADNRQFVAEGIHPKTMEPYAWKFGLPKIDDLPFVSTATLHAILDELRPLLPAASELKIEGAGAGSDVDQETLRGDPVLVEKAVGQIVNTSDRFPTRESYLDVGYAIKASLPDDPAFAFELFADWCARWRDGENNPDVAHADWDRMKPPFRRGAQFLFRAAEDATGTPGAFTVERFFDTAAADAAILADAKKEMAEKQAPLYGENLPKSFEQPTDVYPLLSVADLMAMPEPKFLIDRHVTDKSVGFVYGDPGVGKSFVTLDWALHLASGSPDWHGNEIEPVPGASVVYLAGEGVSGYRARISAWLARHPDADPALSGFKLFHEPINFMSPDDINKLVRTLRSVDGRIAMTIVDTVSRTLPGAEENSTKEMSLFIAGCTRLSKIFSCAVVGVHHTNKSGGMRGSTTFPGGADFIFKMERKKGSSTAHLFCEKQKDAPDGWSDTYQLENVCIGVDAKGKPKSSLVVSKEAAAVQVATTQANMLDALDAAWKEGRPWSDQPRSKERYAPRIMSQSFDVSASHAQEILSSWMAAGVVVADIVSARSKTKGLRRVLVEAENEEETAFD